MKEREREKRKIEKRRREQAETGEKQLRSRKKNKNGYKTSKPTFDLYEKYYFANFIHFNWTILSLNLYFGKRALLKKINLLLSVLHQLVIYGLF